MKSKFAKPTRSRLLATALAAMAAIIFMSSGAHAFTLNVVDSGGTSVPNFRWTLEEDTMFDVKPGLLTADIPSLTFHPSYMPIVATGDETTATITVDATKQYFVSVLPGADYSIGGAPVPVGAANVTVVVNAQPILTAQITIKIFEDNHPTNNALDSPQEQGLAGFTIIVEDAGGRYGMSTGRLMTDAYGNMVGTTYNRDINGNVTFTGDAPDILTMGDMSVTTDANGEAIIKNLAPAKYGIIIIPPSGEGWQQVTTLEGTPVIDAWVKADEPPYFREFGPPGYHVVAGFVRPTHETTILTGGATISGTVVNLHNSRPPDTRFWPGEPRGSAWVALNADGGIGQTLHAQPCDPELGTFTIPDVPPGNYEVVVWDKYLDNIIAFHKVLVTDTNLKLGEIPVFQWFTALDQRVFYDANENGFRDAGEMGIPEVGTNIRWRDGTMYQSFPTDIEGEAPYQEVFPFFHWLVAEVDFTHFKATGATITVDNGGSINATDPWSFGGILSPQPQPDNAKAPYRTEIGPVLTQAFQGFMGQTSVIEWGKCAYGENENGGISGIVYYATTRAEDNPQYAAAEPWEPGIPRVQVNLYADGDVDASPCGAQNFPVGSDIDWNGNETYDAPDGLIDDVNGDNVETLADVDNYPFHWSMGGAMGPEDIDHNNNSLFNGGDAINITWTDSWDDAQPTGCPGAPFTAHGVPTDCFDGLRNFNQVRPGVFDGGYAFNGLIPGGYDTAAIETMGLPPGSYIVEGTAPNNYLILKPEDKNVDFGDAFIPSTQLLPPVCVGEDYIVPATTSLFPDVVAPFAGTSVKLCDKKSVALNNGMNAAADFFLLTQVPISAHVVGFVLDDLANEYDPLSPSFGEKYAPPWLPVSFTDFKGNEIAKVYTDEWGKYNALLPSTYTTNLPSPSGMAPAMLTVCINSPLMPDPNNPGEYITDPFYKPQYSQFCYTFQYMPGTTTYLDTPVLPIAAFAGPKQFPLDCAPPTETPMIQRVDGASGGPVVNAGLKTRSPVLKSHYTTVHAEGGDL